MPEREHELKEIDLTNLPVAKMKLEFRPVGREVSPWKDVSCADCGSKGEDGRGMAMFVLKDEVWLSAAKVDEVLCFDCTEKRLRRRIVIEDLKPCGVTDTMLLGKRLT